MNNMKRFLKNSKGITLIALVITIIVLLILAGISISMLSGDNGILQKATQSKERTERAEIIETAKMDILAKITEKKGENITEDELKYILTSTDYATQGTLSDNDETSILEKTLISKDEKYEISVSEIYNGPFLESVDLISTLAIGTATNTEKYGWMVPEYTKNLDETGCWRLFYQDETYTYIISDNLIGSYKPSDYYSSYTNGLAVGTIGKKLNPSVSELFTEENTDNTIKATAWLTDDRFWNNYVGNDAIFAIGSPTVELFVESYNNTGKTNTITLGNSSHGYSCNVGVNWLNVSDNYGIYNKEQTSSSTWWLASPCDAYNPYTQEYKNCWTVYGYNGFFLGSDVTYAHVPVRPLVCIPTSIFNAKYTLVDE